VGVQERIRRATHSTSPIIFFCWFSRSQIFTTISGSFELTNRNTRPAMANCKAHEV